MHGRCSGRGQRRESDRWRHGIGRPGTGTCKQLGGKVGPNCCQMPDGNIGLSPSGQMVQGVACQPSGLGGGSVPLIAGAAIAAVLLMKFM